MRANQVAALDAFLQALAAARSDLESKRADAVRRSRSENLLDQLEAKRELPDLDYQLARLDDPERGELTTARVRLREIDRRIGMILGAGYVAEAAPRYARIDALLRELNEEQAAIYGVRLKAEAAGAPLNWPNYHDLDLGNVDNPVAHRRKAARAAGLLR
jgi:hypothetical protein